LNYSPAVLAYNEGGSLRLKASLVKGLKTFPATLHSGNPSEKKKKNKKKIYIKNIILNSLLIKRRII
jgi:hypothetical protein